MRIKDSTIIWGKSDMVAKSVYKYIIKRKKDLYWPYVWIEPGDHSIDWLPEFSSKVTRFTYDQAKVIIEVFKLQDCKIVKLVSKKKKIK